ncbi:Gtr1/RagA G protein conserved region-domain-containing protein [Kockovaella imperatae]|uniref:GTP-binding protein n=1 Tax=Kockovaella imperatae TaxID=4999 RepID=A0A1Y1USX8_9TREE|nr:Gtr1/RagA G protein conserved region-domain-containing protein [Kockovaella imperatae]ORX41120.1 Gtr1/RagA G protein conserved region-domain-containing protein [Kockovaella imperatae]
MSATAKRKVLLMGKSGSGKTSMRSVIFQNYSARDTRRLGATIDVEQSAVRFLGSLVLNLWDCGGQNAFVDNYLTAQKDTIFANVAVLIYVFDITSTEWENDVRYFEEIISALRENSSDAGVWVLINKMDLVDKEDPKRKKYAERSEDIVKIDERVRSEMSDDGRRGGLRCFPTSIWDESLYKAWSSVIHTLIPNINLITAHLTYLRDICMAVEAVAFEAETFLVISKSGSPLDSNEAELDDQETRYGAGSLSKHRFEKISEIIKGFRKTCQRTGESFTGFEAKFDDCTVVLEPLTQNQFVLVVAADPIVESALIQYNIYHSQSHLAEFARKSVLDRKCGICRRNTELKYEVKDDDDPSVLAWDEAWDRLKQVNGRLNERISRVEIGD